MEADNLKRFQHNFAHSGYPVVFPTPMPGLVSPDVLVETWEGGQNMQAMIDIRCAAEAKPSVSAAPTSPGRQPFPAGLEALAKLSLERATQAVQLFNLICTCSVWYGLSIWNGSACFARCRRMVFVLAREHYQQPTPPPHSCAA